jgi:hypothetical protein
MLKVVERVTEAIEDKDEEIIIVLARETTL